MGCFLGCFGISNSKRKRRKPANKRILPRDSKLVSYEPLDSSVPVNLENPIPSDSQLSDKAKERSSVKVRKKVSFNLNVQTYEPIPFPDEETTTYKFLQSVEEKESEQKKNGAEEAAVKTMGSYSYPNNYRYQNCRESYDEEDDDMIFQESDLEDDDYDDDYYDDDDDDDDDGDDQRGRPEEFLDQFDSLNLDESKSVECGNARMRSQHLCSVLNPVENTSQWREIKAISRSAPAAKPRMKENVAVEEEPQFPLSSKLSSKHSPNFNQSRPLMQDIAVDASLSNWLSTSSNSDESKTTASTIKPCCGTTAFDSFSWRSREDRVILDITNFEGL